MRTVIQRVSQASVEVKGRLVGKINTGLLVYLSIGKTDTLTDAKFLADKLVSLRIFADDADKMNRSVLDIHGDILLISNFTLHGDCRKGRRPGFDQAAEPEMANQLYEKVIELVSAYGIKVEKGIFTANMNVSSVNNGPVTFILDSSRLF
jgi:D-aminoacyl-tRNA deacylase